MFLHTFHESEVGHNASDSGANINRACREGCSCDQTAWYWFVKFRSEDGTLDKDDYLQWTPNI